MTRRIARSIVLAGCLLSTFVQVCAAAGRDCESGPIQMSQKPTKDPTADQLQQSADTVVSSGKLNGHIAGHVVINLMSLPEGMQTFPSGGIVGKFTTHNDSLLMITVSGSGFRTDQGCINLQVEFDGITRTVLRSFEQQGSWHTSFVPQTFFLKVGGGEHNIRLDPLSGTLINADDNLHVSVLEYY